MIYAGIGSRETPSVVLVEMEEVADYLATEGWTLRSGGAAGADAAFERGATRGALPNQPAAKEIYLPDEGYKGHRGHGCFCPPKAEAYALAECYHPNWLACSSFARKLHARNSHIILGWDLHTPVDFVLCWTPGGRGGGGTGQGIRIARAQVIPVFDMAAHGWTDACAKFLIPLVARRNAKGSTMTLDSPKEPT